LHDQLASLGRHAQLTRCFSAVAELLVQKVADKAGTSSAQNLVENLVLNMF